MSRPLRVVRDARGLTAVKDELARARRAIEEAESIVAAIEAQPDAPARGDEHARRAVGITEAAEMMGISKSLLEKMLPTGNPPSFKIAGRRLIAVEDIDAFIAQARAGER